MRRGKQQNTCRSGQGTRNVVLCWPGLAQKACVLPGCRPQREARRQRVRKGARVQTPSELVSGGDETPVEVQPPRTLFVRAGAHAPTTEALALPGSKYYTLRYLLNALLAEGESVVR